MKLSTHSKNNQTEFIQSHQPPPKTHVQAREDVSCVPQLRSHKQLTLKNKHANLLTEIAPLTISAPRVPARDKNVGLVFLLVSQGGLGGKRQVEITPLQCSFVVFEQESSKTTSSDSNDDCVANRDAEQESQAANNFNKDSDSEDLISLCQTK